MSCLSLIFSTLLDGHKLVSRKLQLIGTDIQNASMLYEYDNSLEPRMISDSGLDIRFELLSDKD